MPAYYATSYSFGGSTTSTLALLIWKALSDHLVDHQLPLTAQEIAEMTGITEEQVDRVFGQDYYQRYYGFKRFNSLEEWRAWAEESGVLATDEPEEELDEDGEAAEGEQETAPDEQPE